MDVETEADEYSHDDKPITGQFGFCVCYVFVLIYPRGFCAALLFS